MLVTLRLLATFTQTPPEPSHIRCICFGTPALANNELNLIVHSKEWGKFFHHYVLPRDPIPQLFLDVTMRKDVNQSGPSDLEEFSSKKEADNSGMNTAEEIDLADKPNYVANKKGSPTIDGSHKHEFLSNSNPDGAPTESTQDGKMKYYMNIQGMFLKTAGGIRLPSIPLPSFLHIVEPIRLDWDSKLNQQPHKREMVEMNKDLNSTERNGWLKSHRMSSYRQMIIKMLNETLSIDETNSVRKAASFPAVHASEPETKKLEGLSGPENESPVKCRAHYGNVLPPIEVFSVKGKMPVIWKDRSMILKDIDQDTGLESKERTKYGYPTLDAKFSTVVSEISKNSFGSFYTVMTLTVIGSGLEMCNRAILRLKDGTKIQGQIINNEAKRKVSNVKADSEIREDITNESLAEESRNGAPMSYGIRSALQAILEKPSLFFKGKSNQEKEKVDMIVDFFLSFSDLLKIEKSGAIQIPYGNHEYVKEVDDTKMKGPILMLYSDFSKAFISISLQPTCSWVIPIPLTRDPGNEVDNILRSSMRIMQDIAFSDKITGKTTLPYLRRYGSSDVSRQMNKRVTKEYSDHQGPLNSKFYSIKWAPNIWRYLKHVRRHISQHNTIENIEGPFLQTGNKITNNSPFILNGMSILNTSDFVSLSDMNAADQIMLISEGFRLRNWFKSDRGKRIALSRARSSFFPQDLGTSEAAGGSREVKSIFSDLETKADEITAPISYKKMDTRLQRIKSGLRRRLFLMQKWKDFQALPDPDVVIFVVEATSIVTKSKGENTKGESNQINVHETKLDSNIVKSLKDAVAAITDCNAEIALAVLGKESLDANWRRQVSLAIGLEGRPGSIVPLAYSNEKCESVNIDFELCAKDRKKSLPNQLNMANARVLLNALLAHGKLIQDAEARCRGIAKKNTQSKITAKL